MAAPDETIDRGTKVVWRFSDPTFDSGTVRAVTQIANAATGRLRKNT